jgi:hypothetical protein
MASEATDSLQMTHGRRIYSPWMIPGCPSPKWFKGGLTCALLGLEEVAMLVARYCLVAP